MIYNITVHIPQLNLSKTMFLYKWKLLSIIISLLHRLSQDIRVQNQDQLQVDLSGENALKFFFNIYKLELSIPDSPLVEAGVSCSSCW